MSSRALNLLADLLRGHRAEHGTRWRKLPAGRQALRVVAHLRKNDTYAELACMSQNLSRKALREGCLREL